MTQTMPEELAQAVHQMTPLQKAYCEYRAKGLSQAQSALKAGSNAADSSARARVGYQIEQMPGCKDYIVWLQSQRATSAVVDQLELINMLRKVYDRAMQIDKLKEANTSVELLGECLGILGTPALKLSKEEQKPQETKPTTAFLDEEEQQADHHSTTERVNKLQQMLIDVNKG